MILASIFGMAAARCAATNVLENGEAKKIEVIEG